MNNTTGPYHIVKLPPARRVWLNLLDLPSPKHYMYGLLEVDVTVPRRYIADYKARTGETLSFTGYLTYCVGRAVGDDKEVQAYLKGRGQLVVFDDVNVGLMIERKAGDKPVLMGYVVRGANRKTCMEIHREIREVQATPVPPSRGAENWFRAAMGLPFPLAQLCIAVLGLVVHYNPLIPVSMSGTVGITAVGMFGKGHSGWGLASIRHSLGLVVGSTSWKPAVVEGCIVPREILNLTLLFDHNVIDGAPAARFTRRLVEEIESANGLCSAL